MNDETLAKDIYRAVMDFDKSRPRSQQSENFVVGMSELGFCSERTRRMLAGIVPEETDKLAAFYGTAIGDYVEQAICAEWPHAIRQAEIDTELVSDDGRVYVLGGHPDIILPDWGVLDVKTDRGLAIVRRNGPSEQQQYQRHGYAKGAHAAGLFGDMPLEEVRVANVWFDRAADEKECYVQSEPFSHDVLREATHWLDEVVSAYLSGSHARKEPPRQMCEVVCGHFKDCRALDTDVEGLLTDPRQITAAQMYRDGLDLEREGKRLKDQAKAELDGISGSTGKFAIRWVHVNESEIKPGTRQAYDRLDIRPI